MSAAVVVLLTSCGGAEESNENQENDVAEETGPTFEESCATDNDVFVQIEKYGHNFDSTFTYKDKIEIVRSEWSQKDDSTATLSLYNYDLGAADTATNFKILVEFHSKNGQVLQAADYGYNDYDSDFWARVNIISPLGTVWFNWSMGMPKQGYVKLNYLDKENACGEFTLEVDKPTSNTIGHVVLKGPFKTL